MYFHSPRITQRKVPICLLQLRSPSKMNNNRSPPDFAQPQEETKRSSSPISSSSGQDLNPQWVTYVPLAPPLPTSVPPPLPTSISVSVVLQFVFIKINTEVLRNYNNKMTQLQTCVLMSRRRATVQARRGLFFLRPWAEPMFHGQMGFFLKLEKHCLL